MLLHYITILLQQSSPSCMTHTHAHTRTHNFLLLQHFLLLVP